MLDSTSTTDKMSRRNEAASNSQEWSRVVEKLSDYLLGPGANVETQSAPSVDAPEVGALEAMAARWPFSTNLDTACASWAGIWQGRISQNAEESTAGRQ